MTTLVLTIAFMGICMLAMAVGVILTGKRLSGSCGGPGSDDCLCEIEKRQACAAHERMLARLASLRKDRDSRKDKDLTVCSD